MSNKLHKKKQKILPAGHSKLNNKYICISNKQKNDRASVVSKSFIDMKAIMLYTLVNKFNFGKMRLKKFQDEINMYLEKARTDKSYSGSESAYELMKYKINVQKIVNKVAFRDVIKLYYEKALSIKQDEVYILVSAAIYNIFAICGVILKKSFKFSTKNIDFLLNESKELLNDVADYDTYQLTPKLMAECIAEEKKYYDLDFVEAEC